jgi:nucleoside-diphosphate-sugar epimerase
MGKSLVTGATGFVGRHVVKALLAQGDAVRALVRDPARAVGLGERGVEVLRGDIRDPEAVQRSVRDVDVVYHCAAAVGERYTEREFRETNLEGTRRVLLTARGEGCRRAVLLSSLHVLGIGDLDPATEDLPCCYTYDPASNIKIEMERMALESARGGGTEVVILRPGVIYGPDDPHNLPKLIASLRNGKFRFLGSRDHIVPIVHVADVVQAMLLAAQTPGAGGRIYHVTDGSRTTIGEYVDRVADLAGCARPQRAVSARVVRSLMPLLALARRIHPRFPLPIGPGPLRFLGTSRSVEVRRAREELGYTPRLDYRDGLADALGGVTEPSLQGGATHAVPT